MRANKKTRAIKAEQICIGDTIRVSWKDRDVTYSVVGTVNRREHGTDGTEWLTSELFVLLYRDNAHRVWNAGRARLITTITLLDRIADRETPLPGMDNI